MRESLLLNPLRFQDAVGFMVQDADAVVAAAAASLKSKYTAMTTTTSSPHENKDSSLEMPSEALRILFFEKSEVVLDDLPDEVIRAYVNSKEPLYVEFKVL